jgi:kumamolisin
MPERVEAASGEVLEVTILLRRDPSFRLPPREATVGRPVMDYKTYATRFGAASADASAVASFARRHHLRVLDTDLLKRTVLLKGTVRQFNKAFGVALTHLEQAGKRHWWHPGPVTIPLSLRRVIMGVFGLDSRPVARRPHTDWPDITPPPVGPHTRPPREFARLYDFPANSLGAGQCIGVIEFGGGFTRHALSKYLAAMGLQTPKVVVKEVTPGKNRLQKMPGQLGPDVEVCLDLEMIASLAPEATIVTYFGENNNRGWLHTLQAAVFDTVHRPSVISLSWGAAEDTWNRQTIAALTDIFQSAAQLGITICCASGDRGVREDENHPFTVPFPASSPWVLACGGTRLSVAANGRQTETVWNQWAEYELASGGGVSRRFPKPEFQRGYRVPPRHGRPGAGRGLPDVAANASSVTGYLIETDGDLMSMGGTSAAAPLWAALVARLNQALGRRIGYLTPLLYTKGAQAFGAVRGITKGFNGASPREAYRARPGWNACTGLGSPRGTRLLAWLETFAKDECVSQK